MHLRAGASLLPVVLLVLGLAAGSLLAPAPGVAADPTACAVPARSCADADRAAGQAVPPDVPPDAQAFDDGIPNATLSLYKTITYVPTAALTDQLWYLIMASEAATTGGLFLGVNATTSSLMTYTYEYVWNICCQAPPGPDGVVPVSATKAIVYRALSVVRVGALALAFGNTLPSSTAVTTAITISRTAVYVANDYVWNNIDTRRPVTPDATPAVETAAGASLASHDR